MFRSGLPRRLQLDLRLAREPQVSVTPLVFAADPSMDCAGTSNCQQYTVEEVGQKLQHRVSRETFLSPVGLRRDALRALPRIILGGE